MFINNFALWHRLSLQRQGGRRRRCCVISSKPIGIRPELMQIYEKIRQIMVNLRFIHCDVTQTRVDGKTWWVHNVSDRDFIYLSIHQKRGHIGMDAAGILPDFHGASSMTAGVPAGSIRMSYILCAVPIC